MPGTVAVADDRRRRTAGPVRVRPPRPHPAALTLVLVALAAVFAAAGIGSLVGALRDDGGTYPGSAWRGRPQPPRSAKVDAFAGTGPFGAVAGFGTWSDPGGDWRRRDGWASSDSAGVGVATVDATSIDAIVHARFARTAPGTGVVVSAPSDGVGGLWLVTDAAGTGWDLVFQGPQGPDVIQSFPVGTQDVVVEVMHRGDTATVQFDTTVFEVAVPAASRAGTFVGLVGSGPGNRVDLFGYLPLPAG